jgi:hypothetical protein
MATNAERQAAFRQRRDARIRELEEALRNRDEGAEVAKLKAELVTVEHTLALAMNAIKMLKAQNKRLRNGEEEPAPPDLDLAHLEMHDSVRESYEKAPPNVKTWLNAFAALPRKDANDAYQAFLCLTAVEALPMGKSKKAATAGKPQDARQPAKTPT